MTNEFKHASVGDELAQAEWEAIGTHIFDSQATGDILYASSATQLSRLGIGTTNYLLTVSSGIPAWTATPTITSLTTSSFDLGTSGSPISYTAGSPLVEIYATSSNTTSTSAEPFYLKSIMTGASGTGGRARFHLYTDVALGGWSNALKAYTEYGSSGSTIGMGSALCAEIAMSAGTTSGTYAPLESELVADSAVSSGTATSFLYGNIAGSNATGKTTLNTNAYLFELGAGVVDTVGGIFESETNTDSLSMTHVLKIRIGGTAYYIPLNTAKTF